MAVTIALAGATRHTLKYKLTSTDATTGNLDAAGAATPDLITDSKTGTKLRTFVSTARADQAAARIALFENADINVYLLPRDVDALWLIDATVNVTALRITAACAAAGGDALGTYLMVEHRHSTSR